METKHITSLTYNILEFPIDMLEYEAIGFNLVKFRCLSCASQVDVPEEDEIEVEIGQKLFCPNCGNTLKLVDDELEEDPGYEPECPKQGEEDDDIECEFEVYDGGWWCLTHNCYA